MTAIRVRAKKRTVGVGRKRKITDRKRRMAPQKVKSEADIHVAGYVILTLEFRQAGNQWAGLCRELGTASCGDSLDEARVALEELITLHLNSLETLGERRAFFKKHNIHMRKNKPRTTKAIPVDFGDIVERVTEPVPAIVAVG